jgi:hypothetical protein
MKESIISKKILTVMFGLLFVGGATAILGIYRAAKNTDPPLGYVVQEQDGETFVYGAHA